MMCDNKDFIIITGSKCCGFIAILKTLHLHVKRYKIDSLSEVYYFFTCCNGRGHMMDPTIADLLSMSNDLTSTSSSVDREPLQTLVYRDVVSSCTRLL